jgi:hypothetical protein
LQPVSLQLWRPGMNGIGHRLPRCFALRAKWV